MTKRFCYLERQRLDAPLHKTLNHLWFAIDPDTRQRMGVGYRTRRQIEQAVADCGDMIVLQPGVTPEMYDSVMLFRSRYPHTWRSRIRRIWATGGDEQYPLLRQLRNIIGPTGLEKWRF